MKRQVAPYLDLQLVAFPQDGILRYDPRKDDPACRSTAFDLLKKALDLGVDVVGGIPHFEQTMQSGADSVRLLCEEAERRGLRVDMHCDETDDPMSRHIETLAFEARRLGLQGRVNGSHLTSMHSMDNYYVSKLIPLIAEAGVSAIANPLINITHPGPARHLSQAPRHDPGAGAARRRRDGGVRPRLRDGSLVRPRFGRHAGGSSHGAARGADDRARRDEAVLRRGHRGTRRGSWGSTATVSSQVAAPISCCCRRRIRSRRSGCGPTGWRWSGAAGWLRSLPRGRAGSS